MSTVTIPLKTMPNGSSFDVLLAERTAWAAAILRECVEIDPTKRSGVPILRGTRFTVAQVFAELADGQSIDQIAESFDLDVETLKQLLHGFATNLDRPITL